MYTDDSAFPISFTIQIRSEDDSASLISFTIQIRSADDSASLISTIQIRSADDSASPISFTTQIRSAHKWMSCTLLFRFTFSIYQTFSVVLMSGLCGGHANMVTTNHKVTTNNHKVNVFLIDEFFPFTGFHANTIAFNVFLRVQQWSCNWFWLCGWQPCFLCNILTFECICTDLSLFQSLLGKVREQCSTFSWHWKDQTYLCSPISCSN